MKGLRIILVLSFQLSAHSYASTRARIGYPPCGTQSTFTIRNSPAEAEGDVDFAFRLSTGFDDYTSLCSGQWRSIQTDWQECDENTKDSNVMFRGTASGYLDVTHRYLCKLQDESTENDEITLGIANGSVILDFSQGENITFNAYISLAHRKPNTACTDASLHPVWIVDSFSYSTGYLIVPGGPGPGGPAGVIASLSGTMDQNNDTLIDPNKDWPCPSPYGSDLIPADDYPTSSFRFDKAKRLLTLQQQWRCDDSGDWISFSARGGTNLPPECTTVPESNCNATKFVIEGEVVP
ncbi:hypothetical protein F4776DRAFT_659559 [Hypoxylon sp. NC0597]|nr:hypothetical protein F4776DRAFT_659559 [Hypoxylon sp. NC0597]